MKTLVLKSNRTEMEQYFIEHMNNEDCTAAPYYKSIVKNKYIHYIAVIWMQKLQLPFASFWYGSWKKRIKTYQKIILFDRVWGYEIIRFLKKNNPNCRIIFWYWNTLIDYDMLPQKYRELCECWTFDPVDAKKFNMNYNNQFYFPQNTQQSVCNIDAIFLGADKGRVSILSEIAEELEKADKSMKIIVVGKSVKDSHSAIEFCRGEMGYYQYIELMKKSKCIIDVEQKGQTGIALRVLEALMFRKKLITTNDTVKSLEFYTPENIFIWGKDDEKSIGTFIDSPYINNVERYENKYSFSQWLDNFDAKNEKKKEVSSDE